jgi:hypothetical protein
MSKPGLLLAAVLAAAFSSAQDQDFSKVQIKVTKVAGNVYMLQGEGGNIGASVGDDGIVVVDDQYAPLAEKIQAALKGITDKPIRFIINTTTTGTIPGRTNSSRNRRPLLPTITSASALKRVAPPVIWPQSSFLRNLSPKPRCLSSPSTTMSPSI